MGATATDHLSRVFGALADPTRRAILDRLSKGEAGVQEIAKPFNMSLPRSRSTSRFSRKQFDPARERCQWRPCSLEAAPLKQASDWIGDYRQFWEESFERLDEYLKEMQAKEKTKKGEEDHGKQD
jgi:DNA-binding transcriptional ArsR family regulator